MLYNLDLISKKVPAISHIDNTCRVQTLRKSFNPHFYNLIKEFYKITGIPILLNTSFNLAGDTIVETIEDAMRTLNDSDIDHIYFPEKGIIMSTNFIYKKKKALSKFYCDELINYFEESKSKWESGCVYDEGLKHQDHKNSIDLPIKMHNHITTYNS